MIGLAVRFLSGRFHATPWGHHVNEGVPEWPPAPWRLLRALAAAYHETGGPDPHRATDLFRKLSSPPSYFLPPAAVAHTRHYLSLNQLDRAKTSLTFDTFVLVDPDVEMVTAWDVKLDADERRLLELWSARLSYLGRAESWCDVRVVDDPAILNCSPSNGIVRPHTEPVRLLCGGAEIHLEDLERTTAQLQKEGWSAPPGSRWVVYRRPSGCLRSSPSVRARALARPVPQIAEFALGGPVLPLYVDAVRVAEKLRSAALSRHSTPSAILAGKDEGGRPLQDDHRHAHYIPDSRDIRGRITHVVVWAPGGLGPTEQAALAGIDYLNLHDGHTGYWAGRDPLSVVLCGFAEISQIARSALFGRGRRWRSRTPLVLPRHPKRGRDGAEEQLVRELRLRGLPEPRSVQLIAGVPLGAAGASGITRWMSFEVRRRKARPTTPIVGFEMEFDLDVQGPILLGWGCHYGLGAFELLA